MHPTSSSSFYRALSSGWSLNTSQRQSLAIIGILLLLLITVTLAAVVAERAAVDQLRRDGESQLNLFVSNMRSELDKYAFLPQVLARSERLISVLLEPQSGEKVSLVNRYLERVNSAAEAADVYLMDRDGLTIAASNWASPKPFVGQNFSYRPYFQQAIEGEAGRYFALGTTSNVRGYYYSYPVEWGSRILGVIVVKVDLDRLESAWAKASQRVVVTDLNGVIFITNHPPWRLKTMRPLSPELAARVAASRQFGDLPLVPLDIVDEQPRGEGSKFLTLRNDVTDVTAVIGRRNTRFLVQSTQLDREQWIVHMLTDTSSIAGQVLTVILLVTVLFAVVVLAVIYMLQRRRILREQLVHQQQVEATLNRARSELEERVRERTADLLRTNRELDHEIEQHKRAEEELRRTQSELIQAAKLAVIGQMSAGVTHELNQPLAAIQSYAENALVYLQRDSKQQALQNLTTIRELTERMAHIIGHLKTFARKSDNQVKVIDFKQSLSNALVLLTPRMRKQGVTIHQQSCDRTTQVSVDAVRLEQVLVNIIKNAVDAMQINRGSDLYLDLHCDAARLEFTVRDSGPGIDPEHLPQLFDPFFTTKDAGDGLGLGLSISYGIIRDFGGELSARNHPQGGAEFCIELPLAESVADHHAA